MASSHSYYGVASTGSYAWLKEITDISINYGKAWNNDLTLIGHSSYPFVYRGGSAGSGTGGGVFYTDITYGYGNHNNGFRVSLTP